MPEGPEIRQSADQLAKVLDGKKIEAISFGLPRLKRFEEKFCGHKLLQVTNHGKALLNHFDNGWSIYSHNQLYGLWTVTDRGKMPKTNRSLRMALHTKKHSALLYSASDISVWPTEELSAHPFLKKLGPDILDSSLDWQTIAQRLQDEKFRKRSLAALYLDQSFLAGIGNYLRSEILFSAKVNPWLHPADLTRKQINDLARASLSVSWQSYETFGTTNSLKRAAKLEQQGYDFESRRFKIFNREALPCYTCNTAITNTPVSSRRLYWCKNCQNETTGNTGHPR